MLSQLGPLFKTTFRQAEENDTRQKIPHEERDNPSRGNQKDKREEPSDFWEDNTSVSVEALRTFLINFTKTSPEAINANITSPLNEEEDIQLSTRPHEPKRPTNTQNAKAVRAYQATAEQSQKTPERHDTLSKSDIEKIESKELRDIYQLIYDLEILQNKGIREIEILRAESFVESLKNAVKIKKSYF